MSEVKTREIRISIPEDLFPFALTEKTVGHLFQAKKEILLALRSLIDAKIEMLEKTEKKKVEKKRKIKID